MNEFRLAQPPAVTHEIWITETFCIHATGRVPDRFHRWMMGKLFGWRFVIRDAP